MNFFSKFKVHLHNVGDTWYIRKLTPFGYRYMSNNGDVWWWTSMNAKNYCQFPSEESARNSIPKSKAV